MTMYLCNCIEFLLVLFNSYYVCVFSPASSVGFESNKYIAIEIKLAHGLKTTLRYELKPRERFSTKEK